MCNLSEGVFAKGVKQGIKLQEAETAKIKEELEAERNEWQSERSTYTAEIARLREQVARLQQN